MALGLSEIVALSTPRARAEAAPSLGGGIVRYCANGFDWLRAATPETVAEGKAGDLACFPLVPYSNRIRDATFTFEGRRIALSLDGPHALHGHGWRAAWAIVKHDPDRLTVEYRHSAADWPFDYRARQTFELTDDALTVTLEVSNESRESMPCGLGLHPYFPRTPRAAVTAEVEAMWQSDAEVLPVRLQHPPPAGLDPGRGLRVGEVALDTVFTGWSREAKIEWPEHGRRLVMTASPPLDFLVIYSPTDTDYFCVEPVSNCTDAFNLAAAGRTDTGMLVLQPEETVSATVTFRPE